MVLIQHTEFKTHEEKEITPDRNCVLALIVIIGGGAWWWKVNKRIIQ